MLTLQIHPSVSVEVVDKQIVVKWSSDEARAMAGTMRALISNCVIGVTQGYVKNIKLNGVGYRAKVEGKKITLTLGFSHPVIYELPPEVDAKSEGQTEFNLPSINKQILGQVSSEIRALISELTCPRICLLIDGRLNSVCPSDLASTSGGNS